jgi:hypothetical protein
MQRLLVVDLHATAEQHIQLAAAQGAEQGRGVAQGHQGQATVGWPAAPVALEGSEPLLLIAEERQSIGPGAHEAVVERLIPMAAVGGG